MYSYATVEEALEFFNVREYSDEEISWATEYAYLWVYGRTRAILMAS